MTDTVLDETPFQEANGETPVPIPTTESPSDLSEGPDTRAPDVALELESKTQVEVQPEETPGSDPNTEDMDYGDAFSDLDEAAGAWGAEMAQRLGLSEEQAKSFAASIAEQLAGNAEQVKALHAAQQQAQAESDKKFIADQQAQLKEAWGGQYKERLRHAERATGLMEADTKKALKDTLWLEDAGVAKFLAKVGAMLSEDGPGPGGDSSHIGPNPYKRETLNLTAQSRLESESPDLAKSLKAAAGKTDRDQF